MDQEIGRLLDALERSEEIDRTCRRLHDGSRTIDAQGEVLPIRMGETHSSLIFRGPGVSGSGRVDTGLASTVDIAPTLMSLAGGKAPADCQGISLAPRLGGRSSDSRPYVFSEHHERNHLVAIRSERFKLIRNHTRDEPLIQPYVIRNWQGMGEDTLRQPYPLPRHPEEFYDLAADPLESRNLAEDPAYVDRKAELSAELDRWSEGSYR